MIPYILNEITNWSSIQIKFLLKWILRDNPKNSKNCLYLLDKNCNEKKREREVNRILCKSFLRQMVLKILKNCLRLLDGNYKSMRKEKKKEASSVDLINVFRDVISFRKTGDESIRRDIPPPPSKFPFCRALVARAKFHFVAYRIVSTIVSTISCKRRTKLGLLCLKAGKRLISQIGFPPAARDGRTRFKRGSSRGLFTPRFGRGFMVVVATPEVAANKRQGGIWVVIGRTMGNWMSLTRSKFEMLLL